VHGTRQTRAGMSNRRQPASIASDR